MNNVRFEESEFLNEYGKRIFRLKASHGRDVLFDKTFSTVENRRKFKEEYVHKMDGRVSLGSLFQKIRKAFG